MPLGNLLGLIRKSGAAPNDSTIATDSTWSSSKINTEIQSVQSAVNTIQATDANAEMVAARSSTTKGKTFANLGTRIEDLEADGVAKVKNVLQNPDFAAIIGWTGNGCSVAASGNVGTATGLGTNNIPNIRQTVSSKPITNIIGHQFLFRAKLRVTNADCTNFKINVAGSTSGNVVALTQATPVQDQWYDLSLIYTIPASGLVGNLMLTFQHSYSTAAIANTKVMEIKEVVVADLTEDYGAGSEPNLTEALNLGVFVGVKNRFNAFNTVAWLDEVRKYASCTKFNGKKIVTFGDSITWYDGHAYSANMKTQGVMCVGYQSYMKAAFKATIDNQGVSGNTTPQTNTLIKGYNFTGVDACTIFIGTNDFYQKNTEQIGTQASIGGPFDTATFIGAYQDMVEYILTNAPTVKIYLITPIKGWTNGFGLMPATYPDAIKNIGKLYSLPVCDLYSLSGINDISKATLINDIDSADYDFHPNNEGFKRMADIIVPFLKNN